MFITKKKHIWELKKNYLVHHTFGNVLYQVSGYYVFMMGLINNIMLFI